jgi:hypothetical protein
MTTVLIFMFRKFSVQAVVPIVAGPFRYVSTGTHQPGSAATGTHQPGSQATGTL